MSKQTSIILTFLCSIIILCYGCKEELPSFEDPSKIITAYLGNSYVYSRGQNGIYFTVTVINKFDESLSDRVLMDGQLNIEWIAPLDRIGFINPKRTVKLSTSNITNAKRYNRSTGELTIDPMDSIVIGYVWNFKFDDSTDIRKIPYYGLGFKKLNCSNFSGLNEVPRVLYRSQPFRVSCNVKLFSKMGAFHFPDQIVNSCAINFWPDFVCPDMQTLGTYKTPCDLFN